MTYVARIAEGLNAAQRDIVLKCNPLADMSTNEAMWLSLQMRFLQPHVTDSGDFQMQWSDLGLAVRAHLTKGQVHE
jgi:hypothetical protein